MSPSKETDAGPSSIPGILGAQRVRATYELCQSIGEDLKPADLESSANGQHFRDDEAQNGGVPAFELVLYDTAH